MKTRTKSWNESKDNEKVTTFAIMKNNFLKKINRLVLLNSFDFYLFQINHLLPEKSRSIVGLDKVAWKSDGSPIAF